MDIEIKTIPQSQQRYETIGDYWFDADRTLQIRVSDVGDWRYEALVAVHELVEVLLCKDRGISEPEIMAFDKAFEAGKKLAVAPDVDAEPGDDPSAPYRREHRFAENVERLLAAELGVNWTDYDAVLCAIWHPKEIESQNP